MPAPEWASSMFLHRNLPGGRRDDEKGPTVFAVGLLMIYCIHVGSQEAFAATPARPCHHRTFCKCFLGTFSRFGLRKALPRSVEMAKELCGGLAASAPTNRSRRQRPYFSWTAPTGPAAQFTGRNNPVIFSRVEFALTFAKWHRTGYRPGRYYEWLQLARGLPPLTEAILVPLFVNGNEQFGTLWLMSRIYGSSIRQRGTARPIWPGVVAVDARVSMSGIADKEALASQAATPKL